MSNSFDFFDRRRGRQSDAASLPAQGAEPPFVCRPARQNDIRPALRLILSNHGRLASEEQVVDFLRFAVQRRLNLNDLWVVETRRHNGQAELTWAALPVVSPGRTMLIFSPAHPHDQTQCAAAGELISAICAHWAQRGVHLAQALLEPTDHASQDLYCGCSFNALAELIYLQAPGRKNHDKAEAMRYHDLAWQTYGPHNHAAFAHAIAQSYEESLDCPALNGRREMDDVIAGHKAAGEFDPATWLLLTRGDQPMGVLLLAHARHSDVLELVYIGLTPPARGQGFGDFMMSRALSEVHRQNCAHLSLAVDSRNFPALKLYYRHGMKRVCSKTAMLRDLRTTPVHAAATVQPGAMPVSPSALSSS